MRAVRSSENSENVLIAKTHMPSTTRASGLKAVPANVLKQGAKRTALSDVSNRVPMPVQATGKPVVEPIRKSQLARPLRRAVSNNAIPSIPEDQDTDTDLSDGEQTPEADMEVDALEVASPDLVTRKIAPGAPVVEPAYTKGDRLELQRVADEFVDEWDEWGDISMVQEYADDIFTYMHELEVSVPSEDPRSSTNV